MRHFIVRKETVRSSNRASPVNSTLGRSLRFFPPSAALFAPTCIIRIVNPPITVSCLREAQRNETFIVVEESLPSFLIGLNNNGKDRLSF